MQALSNITVAILAGGQGTRLHSVVYDKPKVLAQINDRPFLTILFDQLVYAGAKNVVLCVGYMAEMVYDVIGETYKSLRLIYSKEDNPLDTGGALRFALPHMCSDIVLAMNGDSFANVNLNDYMAWYLNNDCQISLLLTNVPDVRRYGKVSIADDGLIINFKEKGNAQGSGWINAGIYILEKSLLTAIPEGKAFSLERQFFPKLVGKGLYGYCFHGKFIDIGIPETYLKAEQFIGGV